MPDITTPRDLFLHELGDILYVEQKLTEEVLPKLIQEVQDPDFRKGLERHLEQTRGHITNLEQIFDSMGEQPEAEKCIGFEGLKKEHDELTSEVSETLIDIVDTGAAARTGRGRGVRRGSSPPVSSRSCVVTTGVSHGGVTAIPGPPPSVRALGWFSPWQRRRKPCARMSPARAESPPRRWRC